MSTAPIARDQMVAAIRWWRENRPAAPRAIQKALREAIDLLRSSPKLGAPIRSRKVPGARRMYIEKIDYHVFYRHDDARQTIYLLLFWHAKRRPAKL